MATTETTSGPHIPAGAYYNTWFITLYALSWAVLLLVAPKVASWYEDEVIVGTRGPWPRFFGVAISGIAGMYIGTLLTRLSYSLFATAAMMRIVWSSVAVGIVYWSNGPWVLAAGVVAGDLTSGLHLFTLLGRWKRGPRIEGGRGGQKGTYFSGLLHFGLTALFSGMILYDHLFAASQVARYAGLGRVTSFTGEGAGFARCCAAVNFILALFYARHGPSAAIPSALSRATTVLFAILALVIEDKVDINSRTAILILIAGPSLLSLPLFLIEDLLRFQPDPFQSHQKGE